MREVLRSRYLTRQRHSIAAVCREITQQCRAQGLRPAAGNGVSPAMSMGPDESPFAMRTSHATTVVATVGQLDRVFGESAVGCAATRHAVLVGSRAHRVERGKVDLVTHCAVPRSRSTRAGLVLVVVIAASLLTACRLTSTASTTATSPAAVTDVAAAGGGLPVDDPHSPVAAPGTCHMRSDQSQPLPDPQCTPGAVNPAVTQATLGSTICRSGYTATIRPPASMTDQLKHEQIAAYGDTDTRSRDYEEDHLVSLELGSAPDDPRNLWPEPGASPNPKDRVENDLHRAVCDGRVSLASAQAAIAADWTTAEHRLGVN